MGHRMVVRMRDGWERFTVVPKKLIFLKKIIDSEPSDFSVMCFSLLYL